MLDVCIRHAGDVMRCVTVCARPALRFEAEDVAEERRCPVEVGDRDADVFERQHVGIAVSHEIVRSVVGCAVRACGFYH